MGRCKTCYWWRNKECDFDDWSKPVADEKKFEIDVYALDDSGLEVRMRTGPNFGCTLHREREE